jgi:hypothetical protein
MKHDSTASERVIKGDSLSLLHDYMSSDSEKEFIAVDSPLLGYKFELQFV